MPIGPSRTVQVTVTLDAQDALVILIPGANGSMRTEPLRDLQTLKIILAAKRARMSQTAATIGLDASPTEQQIRHWSKHCGSDGQIVFEDPDCMWCLATRVGVDTSKQGYERARRQLRQERAASRSTKPFHTAGDGSVKVRQLKSKSRKINQGANAPSLDIDFSDLGI